MPVDNKKWKARELRSFVSRKSFDCYRVSNVSFSPQRSRIGDSEISNLMEALPKGSRVDFRVDYDGNISKRRLFQCLDHIIRVHGPDTVVWEEKEDGSGGGSGSDSSSNADSDGEAGSSNQQEGEFIIVDLKGSSSGGTKVGSGIEGMLLGEKTCATGASRKPDQLSQCQDQYQQSNTIMDVPPGQNNSSSVSEKSEQNAPAYGDPKNKGTDPLDDFWGKVTESKGSSETDGSSQLSDSLNCDGSDTDRESLTSNGSTGLNDPFGVRRDAPKIKKHSGGYCTNKERVEEKRRRIEARARKEIHRALYKLLKAVDMGGLDCSPRLEGAKLVREIIYKRYSLARTRRDELEKSMVFITVDNSGSCSSCCDEMLATAMEVQRETPDKIQVLLHSNGWITDTGGNENGNQLDHAVVHLSAGRKVAAVVAFGDWDAGEQYQRIAESGVPLIWLDQNGEDKPCIIHESRRACNWKIDPLFHWDGVDDPKTTAIAFRDMAKQIRRGK